MRGLGNNAPDAGLAPVACLGTVVPVSGRSFL